MTFLSENCNPRIYGRYLYTCTCLAALDLFSGVEYVFAWTLNKRKSYLFTEALKPIATAQKSIQIKVFLILNSILMQLKQTSKSITNVNFIRKPSCFTLLILLKETCTSKILFVIQIQIVVDRLYRYVYKASSIFAEGEVGDC